MKLTARSDEMILCVIPARGGSKGLPGKNIMPLLGKPVIGYTIEAAKDETIIDHIVVSTEDEEIAVCAREFGVEVINRPGELARDNSGIDAVLKHAIQAIEARGDTVDIVVWLKAIVPIRKPGQIGHVVNRLRETSADSVITVKEADIAANFAYNLNEKGCLQHYEGLPRVFPHRQQYPKSDYHNGAVYAIKRPTLMRNRLDGEPTDYYMGKQMEAYIVNDIEYGIEIDNEKDFLICELFMGRELKKDRNAH